MVPFSNGVQKPYVFVRFSNGVRKPDIKMSGFQMYPVFECIRFSNVRFSDPHCSLVPNSDRCYLFRLIQSNKFTLGIAITAILIMEPFKYRAINCPVFRLSVIPLKYLCLVLFRDHSLMMSRK